MRGGLSAKRPRFDSRTVGKAALVAGAGLAGVYGYGAAQFRLHATKGYDLPDPPVPGTKEFGRLEEALTGSPVREGNRVEILRNGAATFPAMLEAIASAQETIDFSTYIYWPGEITDQFSEAFMERASAGVEVTMVLDGYGSAKLDREHVHRLERAGVTVVFFRPPHWLTLHKMNNRMHRRLLVTDGRVGFAGGVGIADVWTGDADGPEHWRETHARLEGPVVRDIYGGFLESLTESTGRILTGRHLPKLDPLEGGVDVQVTRSSVTTGGTAAGQLFYAAIAGAHERFWLTTAYFTASQFFMDALVEAARRGVDVRILVNGPHIDKEVVRKAGQRSYGRLLEAGVRIFEYQRTMLHAKTTIADGWGNLGSSNFDHRSLVLDAELNVSVVDPGLVATLEKHFLDDLEASAEVDLEGWRNRPLPARAGELASEVLRQSL